MPPEIFEKKLITAEVDSILHSGNPERLSKLAGAISKLARIYRSLPPTRHKFETAERFERSNQYCMGLTFPSDHEIDCPAETIQQIDIGMTGWTEHRGSPLGQATRAMRRQIERTAIGLRLDDETGGFAFQGSMHQQFANTLARDGEDRAGIKFTHQLHRLAVMTLTVYALTQTGRGE